MRALRENGPKILSFERACAKREMYFLYRAFLDGAVTNPALIPMYSHFRIFSEWWDDLDTETSTRFESIFRAGCDEGLRSGTQDMRAAMERVLGEGA